LTVRSFQDLILVNQTGHRFWNEMDNSYAFLSACLGTNGSVGRGKANGGGPIWAIFDADAAAREQWDPRQPNVDPNGWFFSADTIAELAGKMKKPNHIQRIVTSVQEDTDVMSNSYVD